MSEQVIDVKGSWRILRQSWRTVGVAVLVGVAAAGTYELVRPPQFSATALVLLPTGGAAGTATRIPVTTDAGVARSAAVLAPAGRQIGSPLSPADLERRVRATAQTSGVLAITATGSSAGRAEALANAVAGSFVNFVTSGGMATSAHAVVGLQSQIDQVDRQLSATQHQIALERQRLATEVPGSSAWQRDSSLVAALTSEQTSLGLELNTLKSQTSQAQFSQATLAQGTQVIQRATTAQGPQVMSILLDLLLGGLAGLLVGCVAILAWRRRDSRLWSRDGLATALGAPVVLSLDVPPRRSSKDWVDLLERYRPGASERWSVRRALHELAMGEPDRLRLAVVAFADDPRGLSQALQTAVVAASSGVETALSVVADPQQVAELQALLAQIGAKGAQVRPCLNVRESLTASSAFDPPELTVTVFVVDRRHPTLGVVDAKIVLSVAAGAVSAEQLAQLAIAATDGGRPVEALFVANPTPGDRTVGVASDNAWPALTLQRHVPSGPGARPQRAADGAATTTSGRMSSPVWGRTREMTKGQL